MTYTLEKREWWVERWLELLDSYRFKKRLERARRYANEGNVLKIEFQGPRVIAKVKGSDAEPYQVTMSLNPFSKEDWHYVVDSLSKKALYSAELLAGEMPSDIEQVFTAGGLSLFPFTLSEVHSRCTCLDKANPCKHIGAVYYQLADRFSEDPFVIFQLRGRTKIQILEALRQLRAKSSRSVRRSWVKSNRARDRKASNPIVLERFWSYNERLDPKLVKIEPQTDPQALLDRLSMPPFPTAEAAAVQQYLNTVYAQVAQQALTKAE
ncbi:MAG: SWIM zinc finger family protein [Cyanobacteria bacterium P01_G01_bin.54]